MAAVVGLMDDLTYTYKNSGKSNQLARVSDAVTTTGVPEVEQFEDGNTSGDDYGEPAPSPGEPGRGK